MKIQLTGICVFVGFNVVRELHPAAAGDSLEIVGID